MLRVKFGNIYRRESVLQTIFNCGSLNSCMGRAKKKVEAVHLYEFLEKNTKRIGGKGLEEQRSEVDDWG